MKGPLRCREHLLAFTLSLLATSPPVSAEEVSIAGNITSAGSSPRVEEPCNEEGCPPCGLLFTKVVEANDSNSLGSGDGLRVQMIDVMERGEPKSGTGFMFEWAAGSLVHACDYLKAMFGESSCTVSWSFVGGKGRREKGMLCADLTRIGIAELHTFSRTNVSRSRFVTPLPRWTL